MLHIPAFVIKASDSVIMKEALSSLNADPIKQKLEFDGINDNELKFELWHAPDQAVAVNFIMDLLDNEHGNKVGVNINLQPNYVTWSSPELNNGKNLSNTKQGCWSKGLYCFWQTDNDERAKVFLKETLLQACLNIVAKPSSSKDTETTPLSLICRL